MTKEKTGFQILKKAADMDFNSEDSKDTKNFQLFVVGTGGE